MKGKIRIHIKVTSRIRIRNTGLRNLSMKFPISETREIDIYEIPTYEYVLNTS